LLLVKTNKVIFYILLIVAAISLIYILRVLEAYYLLLPVALILMVVLYVIVWRGEAKRGKARMEQIITEDILPHQMKKKD
jgi:Flp pilus assembly protein TadB